MRCRRTHVKRWKTIGIRFDGVLESFLSFFLYPLVLDCFLEDCNNQSVIYTLDHDDTTRHSPLSVQVCSYNKLPVARRSYCHIVIIIIARRTCDIVCFVEVSKSRSKPRHMDVKTDPRHCPSSISHRHNTSTSPPQQQTPDHLPYTPPKTLTKTRQHADQVRNTTNTKNTIAPIQT